ncbi:hypothetical protein NL676_018672 [Syzygium grande]|nr:hypothetical protein NL676_018672 [Syzygium grande]
MIDLEQKLVWAENEICYLRDHCNLLDSLLKSSSHNAVPEEFQSSEELDLDLNDSIIIVGGYYGSSWHLLQSIKKSCLCLAVEVGNPGMMQSNCTVWLTISGPVQPSLNAKKGSLAGAVRFALAAVELNGAIYATGGYDGNNYLIYALGGFDGNSMVASVEVYDPRLDCWMARERMNCARGYSAAAVLSESIYVIGGVKADEDIIGIVECYKEGQSWCKTSVRGIGQRCFLSAIVP